ncbi:transforming acidic coiled-coil-containing protein 3-like [Megalops cyprinoides]|uniref:transforming acidic coiled-coil-containing protein 3-like n=1 Tax=Megalops cyprinoides TaxID=118141 RepID=UPI0018652AD9|nr:transforming acidic coiled-coil-containing protein 3-like [Megalops cyprinoides]
MSAFAGNDENVAIGCPKKHCGSEMTSDFVSAKPTGRPSILRQSQMENLGLGNVTKTVKVCFQTPRRDPLTKRIVYPENPQMSGHVDPTETMSTLESVSRVTASPEGKGTVSTAKRNSGKDANDQDKPVVPCSNDDVLIPKSGAYQLDFDNLETMDPFRVSNLMGNSPAKIKNSTSSQDTSQNEPIAKITDGAKEAPKTVHETDEALDATLHYDPVMEHGPADLSTEVCSTDSTVIIEVKQSGGKAEMGMSLEEALDSNGCYRLDQGGLVSGNASQPVLSKGSYSIDFGNLESVNPFQTGGSKLQNSPVINKLPRKGSLSTTEEDEKLELRKEESVLPESKPVVVTPDVATAKASCSLNFDDPNFDPFGVGMKMENSPKCDIQPGPSQTGKVMLEYSTQELASQLEQEDTPVQKGEADESLPWTASPEGKGTVSAAKRNSGKDANDQDKPVVPCSNDDVLIPKSGAYQLDFDNLEAMDPFRVSNLMGNSPAKIKNSTSSQDTSQNEPIAKITDGAKEAPKTVHETDEALNAALHYDPVMEHGPADLSTEVCSTDSTVIIEVKQSGGKAEMGMSLEEALDSNGCYRLDQGGLVSGNASQPVLSKGSYSIDFGNLESVNPFQTGCSKLQNSPVINKLPRKGSLSTTEEDEKLELRKEESVLPESKPVVVTPDVATAKASCSLNFDDPNFDPFGVGMKMENSPKCDIQPGPSQTGKVMLEYSTQELASQLEQEDTPVQKGEADEALPCIGNVAPSKGDLTSIITEDTPPPEANKSSTCDVTQEYAAELDRPLCRTPATLEQVESSQNGFAEADEMFLPGTTFMSADFGQIDYLEQFGSTTFKESALRKQSLYLKFDPLLKDSPKKSTACPPELHNIPLPAPITAWLEKQGGGAQDKKDCSGEKTNGFSFLEDFPVRAAGPLTPNMCGSFDSLVSTLPKPVTSEDAIIEVLQYSQKDMDAAIAKVQAEVKEREDEWKTKYDKVLLDNKEMGDFPHLHKSISCEVTWTLYILNVLNVATNRRGLCRKLHSSILHTSGVGKKSNSGDLCEQDLCPCLCSLQALTQDFYFRKLIHGFEETVLEIEATAQKEKEASQKELQKVLREKEQMATDLNGMERTVAGLLRRLENHKEVFEGYKKNECTLKKCAEDYLARLKKEEQRYQALKTLAQEKLDLANAEIAQVRAHLKAETSALQVQLRREQLKVESLEKSLEQKKKEVEELTKLCDELIVNVQKR